MSHQHHRRKRQRESSTPTAAAVALVISIAGLLAAQGDAFSAATLRLNGRQQHHAHSSRRVSTATGCVKEAGFAWGGSFVAPEKSSPTAIRGEAGGVEGRQPRHAMVVTMATGRGKGSGSANRKPPSLPQGEFRPKQSLGQNYLSDQNYVMKICNHFGDTSEGGRRVLELGPGTGALTQVLHERFPDMLAVDIDQRAIELLGSNMPSLNAVMSDVLQLDYTKLAELRGGPLSVIGNLPYHITSQILFTLCDHYQSVRRAVVTMQLEVAQRIVAKSSTKQYGILSVVFQLYARPQVLFQIPPTVFYPQPSVTSALISLDFTGEEGG
ncbi:unnamed protein product, partial [Ectocarpus sp. 13 AM-2016]